MRRVYLTVALAALTSTACAALVNFPDVPPAAAADGGTPHESGAHDAGNHPHDSGARVDAKKDAHSSSGRDAPGAKCEAGAYECVGDDYEMCVAGEWTLVEQCGPGMCDLPGGGCAVTPATSCAAAAAMGVTAGISNCGPQANQSCCTSLDVPGGLFERTFAFGDGGLVSESDPATVSRFRLDEYPVTVGRFRQYVNYFSLENGGPPDAGSGKHTHLNDGRGLSAVDDAGVEYEPGWAAEWGTPATLPSGPKAAALWGLALSMCGSSASWTMNAGGDETLPINCVSWYQAYAFCIWDGGFLPSEAEWAYAAAGGSAELEYPWGSTPPGAVNQYAIYDCFYDPVDGCDSVTDIAPVGSARLGVGRYGQVDLLGDVEEWTLDTYGTPYPSPCVDCAALSTDPAASRALRGANFESPMPATPTASRGSDLPAVQSAFDGFRCARAP